jgi:type I restriction enzyme R subunit
MLREWLNLLPRATALSTGAGTPATGAGFAPATFLARIRHMLPLVEEGLWPAQVVAIRNLEKSLAANKPRALIQMATGSGKTFTSISFIYRLIKFADAPRFVPGGSR